MKKFIYIIFVIIPWLNLSAQQINEQLKLMVDSALVINPQMQELQQAVRVSESKQELNKTYFLPTVGLNASYSYVDPLSYITTPDGKGGFNKLLFQPANNFSSGLGFNYQLIDIFKIQANIEKTKREINTSNSNLSYYQAQLASQIATVFYSVVYLKNAVAIQDSVLNTLNRNLKLIKNKLLNGDALNVDVLNLQSTLASEEIRKTDLLNQIAKQESVLAYATGGMNTSPVYSTPVVFTLPIAADTSSILKQAETDNPELLLSKAKIESAKADWLVTKSNYKPSLGFIANAGYRNGYQPEIYDTRFNYLVGLNFNYPIYNGGRLHKLQAISNNLIAQQELSFNTIHAAIKRDADIVAKDIKAANEKLKQIDEQIKTAEEAVKITESRYANGVVTQVELFSAINNLQKVQLNALNARYQICSDNIEIARLSGYKWW